MHSEVNWSTDLQRWDEVAVGVWCVRFGLEWKKAAEHLVGD